MSILLGVIEGTEAKIHRQATIRRMCDLVVPLTIKVGLTAVGNKVKPLKYSEKTIFFTNVQQISERTPTDLSTKPTKTQQRVTRAFKNARFQSDGLLLLQRYVL
jgi:ribosomal protein S18